MLNGVIRSRTAPHLHASHDVARAVAELVRLALQAVDCRGRVLLVLATLPPIVRQTVYMGEELGNYVHQNFFRIEIKRLQSVQYNCYKL